MSKSWMIPFHLPFFILATFSLRFFTCFGTLLFRFSLWASFTIFFLSWGENKNVSYENMLRSWIASKMLENKLPILFCPEIVPCPGHCSPACPLLQIHSHLHRPPLHHCWSSLLQHSPLIKKEPEIGEKGQGKVCALAGSLKYQQRSCFESRNKFATTWRLEGWVDISVDLSTWPESPFKTPMKSQSCHSICKSLEHFLYNTEPIGS